MNNQFRESDAQILSRIIQFANERYLRESRINRKSSFNILRVLSAFKQTSQQYMSRKQHIYNWIIYITKNFNPQTYNQWTHAIRQINQISRKSSKSLISHKNSGYSRPINKTVNQFYQREDVDDYINMSVNAHGTEMSGYLVRDFATKSKSNQFRFNSNEDYGSLVAPISSKMHYISFEPEHENKQNLNSGNTNKSDNMKLDNQPTRTPCEQSFIHHLPMSYGSPFVLSKITNNTKDITEIEDDEEQTQQWVNMKTRADVFHQINLKMKSFSALLANFQAFQIFQELHKKTKKFQRSLYYSRFMNSFDQFIAQKQQNESCLTKARKYYQSKLMGKGFKILYVLYQLKIHDPKRKPVDIKKFNSVSFQFLLSTIFNPSIQELQFTDRNDTPKSLRHKSKHFQRMEDFQKMQMISEYFSCNVKLNKQQISKLFEMHNQARKTKIFNILKYNVRNFDLEHYKIKSMMKKSAIKDMLKAQQIVFRNKARLVIMKTNKDTKLLQKCFKGLLQIMLSRRIYAKRQQYLANKHAHSIMSNVLSLWKNRKQQKWLKKLSRETRVQQSANLISNLISKKFMRKIIDEYLNEKVLQSSEMQKRNMELCNKVFSFLKMRVKQRCIHSKIKQIKNENKKRQLFSQWNKMHKINSAVSRIHNTINKQIFIHLRQQSLLQHNEKQLKTIVKRNIYLKGLKQMRICFNLDRQEINNKFQKAQLILQNQQFAVLIRILKQDIKLKKQKQISQQIQQKIRVLRYYAENKRMKEFVARIKQHKNQRNGYENKQKILRSVMGNRSIQVENINYQKMQVLKKTFVRCHKLMKLEVLGFLKQNRSQTVKFYQLQQRIIQYRNNFVKERLSEFKMETMMRKGVQTIKLKRSLRQKRNIVNYFKEITQNKNRKQSQLILKYNNSLYFKSLLGLAKAVIYSKNLIQSLQQFLFNNRKICEGKRLMINSKNQKVLNQKRKLVIKFNLISRLKSNKLKKDSLKEKMNDVERFLKLKQIKVLLKQKHMKIYGRLAKQFEDEAFKKFAVMKVNKAVIRHILKNKEIFMAIKFKASHLCRLSFKGLLMSRNRVQHSENVEQSRSRKFQLHEHISTSYSSL